MKSSDLRKTSLTTTDKRTNRTESWFEMVHCNCPICGHQGNCMINDAGTKIVCTRTNEGIPFGSAGHLIMLNQEHQVATMPAVNTRNYHLHPTAEITQRDQVYRMLLQHADLLNNGQRLGKVGLENLKARGLSDEAIQRHGFASCANVQLAQFLPYEPGCKQVKSLDFFSQAQHLQNQFDQWCQAAHLDSQCWQGVPGCYRWHFKEQSLTNGAIYANQMMIFNMYQAPQPLLGGACPCLAPQKYNPQFNTDGDYYIPALDIDGRIFGMQIRHMATDYRGGKYTWVSSPNYEEGAKVITGANVALVPSLDRKRHQPAILNWLHHARKTVIVTEGLLKSMVTAEHLERVYGHNPQRLQQEFGCVVLGNGGVTQWKTFLPTLHALHATQVIVAYDMDAQTNAMVAREQQHLIQALMQAGYRVARATWNPQYKGIDDALQHNCRINLKPLNCQSRHIQVG